MIKWPGIRANRVEPRKNSVPMSKEDIGTEFFIGKVKIMLSFPV